jgi:hypothetical protein
MQQKLLQLFLMLTTSEAVIDENTGITHMKLQDDLAQSTGFQDTLNRRATRKW